MARSATVFSLSPLPAPMPSGPLSGVRVVDLTRLLPGPFLSQLLADLGADVVKVEEPAGDPARWIPPLLDGAGYVFSAVNRGKRSVAVDLKRPEGVEVVRRLAAGADVFLDSFRPGVLDRLGLSDAELARANPRLVRASLVGYPPGEWRDDPGHDLNYQALAGTFAMQGDARPMPGIVQVADLAGALYAAAGVLAALLERGRTGVGRRVEVALSDAALAFNAMHLLRARGGEPLPARGAWELAGGIPGYRLYRCADGRFVALGALEPRFWGRFVAACGDPSLAPLHLDASPEAHARVEALFLARPSAEWMASLRAAGVPATPVLEPGEALAAAAGGVGASLPLTRAASAGGVPALGEHTQEVLRGLGYSEADVRRLVEAGVVATGAP